MANKSVTQKPRKRSRAEMAKLQEIANFGPAFDDATMYEMEKGAQEFGVSRRLVLVALARDAVTLSRMATTEPGAFGHMFDSIVEFKAHAQDLLKAAECAHLRMMVCAARGYGSGVSP